MMVQALIGHLFSMSTTLAGYGNHGLHDSDELTEVIYG
jgi:hypothetical protein